MPVNPYVKGGTDVRVVDGGSGASVAGPAGTPGTALFNLGALDVAAHALIDHTGITGVGDLTIAAHASLDHSTVPMARRNIGTAVAAVATGDLAAGDGTNLLFWDSSVGTITLSGAGSLGLTATAAALRLSATGANPVVFTTNGTERGRFEGDTSLNLGDGTVVSAWGAGGIAGTPFNVYGNSSGSTVFRHSTFSAAAASSAPIYSMARGRGTPASPTAALSGDTLGVIGIGGLSAPTTARSAFNIACVAEENFATGAGARVEISVGRTGTTLAPEVARINGTGTMFLGDGTIATSAPWSGAGHAAYSLVSYRNGYNSVLIETYEGTDPAAFPGVLFRRGRGTAATPAAVTSGDSLGLLTFQGVTTGSTLSEFARVECKVDGTVGSGDAPGRLVVSTTADGAGTVTERVRINNVGTVYVGDGTLSASFATPFNGFSIYSYRDADNFIECRSFSSTATVGPALHLRHLRGTAASPLISVNGDLAGAVRWSVADSSASTNNIAEIAAYADGVVGAVNTPGRIVFSTMPASTSTIVEAMRITSAQDILVGTTTGFGPRMLVQTSAAAKNAFFAYATGAGCEAIGAQCDSPTLIGTVRSVVRIVDGTAGGAQGTGPAYVFTANNGSTGYQQGAIQGYKENSGVADNHAALLFYINDGSGLIPVQSGRFSSGGTLWLGDITSANTTLNPIAGNAILPLTSLRNSESYWRIQSFTASAADATSVLQGARSRGTAASPASVTTGDYLFRISALGTLTSTAYDNGGHIIFRATEVWNTPANSHGGDISFWTAPNATTGAPIERWSIAHNGHFIAAADNTYNIGSATFAPASVYARTSFIARGASNTLTLADGTITQSAGALNLVSERLQSNALPVPVVLSITSVNLGATGTTSLYTVPAGRTAIITDTVVKPTTATAANGDAVMGIGVAAGEDDIFASQTLTGLNLTTERFKFLSSGVSVVAAAAAVISAGVDTADTGTALVADVYLIGYLI